MGDANINRRTSYLVLIIAFMTIFAIVGLFQLKSPVPKVSGVETNQNIGVYWDSTCTQGVSSIDWGTLNPGQTKTVIFYIRNEGNTRIRLILSPGNYNPPIASNYISLRNGANNCRIEANETIMATSTLIVSSMTRGIPGFSFVVVVSGGTYILGDLNGDGRVDIYDSLLFASAFGTRSGSPGYILAADLDRDGLISVYDGIRQAAQFS